MQTNPAVDKTVSLCVFLSLYVCGGLCAYATSNCVKLSVIVSPERIYNRRRSNDVPVCYQVNTADHIAALNCRQAFFSLIHQLRLVRSSLAS